MVTALPQANPALTNTKNHPNRVTLRVMRLLNEPKIFVLSTVFSILFKANHLPKCFAELSFKFSDLLRLD